MPALPSFIRRPRRRLAPLLVAALATGAVAGSAGLAAADPPVLPAGTFAMADTTLAVPCGRDQADLPTRWYVPASAPKGLVWLQHGFFRTANNVSAMAARYAESGFVVVSSSVDPVNLTGCATAYNTVDNGPFVSGFSDLFADSANPSGALATSFARAATRLGRPDLALPTQLVFSGHSAGGEFTLFAAREFLRLHPDQAYRLRGLVLLDPVNSFLGSNFATAATEVGQSSLPVRVIATAPSAGNLLCLGTTMLSRTTRQPFLGVQLPNAVHMEAEGSSTDLLGEITGGFPTDANGLIVQSLAAAWAVDEVSGQQTAAYYPGGTYYDREIAAGTIVTLATH